MHYKKKIKSFLKWGKSTKELWDKQIKCDWFIIIILTIVIQHTKICSQNINFLANFTLSCYTLIILCENCSKIKINNLRKNTHSLLQSRLKAKTRLCLSCCFQTTEICNAHKTTWSVTLLSTASQQLPPLKYHFHLKFHFHSNIYFRIHLGNEIN